MSIINYISSLPQLANKVHPNSRGINKIRKNARFCLWGLTYSKTLKTILEVFNDERLKPVLDNSPDIIEKPLKPYLCVNWSPTERARHLRDHYQFISETFGSHAAEVTSQTGITLLTFKDSNEAQYQIHLYCGASREGGLGIQLVNDKNQSVYSLAFNISGTEQRTMYIGMVQGPTPLISDRPMLIRTLTRSLHGLRTKALMIEVALILARIWGVAEVKGVSNKGHIYQALRYVGSKRKSVTFDYDDFWTEYGGEPISKYLFSVPVNPPRKDPSTLKKTKRRLYTKRYQWLADAEQAINDNLAVINK
ncbi:hypothetical protein C942_04286 [Photobacterium marinum]|uniref:DUF535 domain-containing protein n=1 Tax=Photobacterium marinum TaxID=1056511 RepID=L8JE90_9GAMM|nr:VirK/YbjX family protein [Photobacterium marinum]ELR66588.1 hypothetical protein C942_04286 [Photobacterium marinum]